MGMDARPLNPFASLEQSINEGVISMLANACGTWCEGQPFGVVFDLALDEGFMEGVVTGVRHTVSMCVANAPGIAEGSVGLSVDGIPYLVIGPVVPDSGGWATFTVMPAGGA